MGWRILKEHYPLNRDRSSRLDDIESVTAQTAFGKSISDFIIISCGNRVILPPAALQLTP